MPKKSHPKQLKCDLPLTRGNRYNQVMHLVTVAPFEVWMFKRCGKYTDVQQ